MTWNKRLMMLALGLLLLVSSGCSAKAAGVVKLSRDGNIPLSLLAIPEQDAHGNLLAVNGLIIPLDDENEYPEAERLRWRQPPVFHQGKLYYINIDDGNRVYVYDPADASQVAVSQEGVRDFCIFGESLYYIDLAHSVKRMEASGAPVEILPGDWDARYLTAGAEEVYLYTKSDWSVKAYRQGEWHILAEQTSLLEDFYGTGDSVYYRSGDGSGHLWGWDGGFFEDTGIAPSIVYMEAQTLYYCGADGKIYRWADRQSVPVADLKTPAEDVQAFCVLGDMVCWAQVKGEEILLFQANTKDYIA